jgi:hypothetical protein
LQICGFFQYGFYCGALYQQGRCIESLGPPRASYCLYGDVLIAKFFSDGITLILRTDVVTDESRFRIRYMNKPYSGGQGFGNVPGFFDDRFGTV